MGSAAEAVGHHNSVVRRAMKRAAELEGRMAAVLEPILRKAGEEAAANFERLATDHLTASIAPVVIRVPEEELDRLVRLRSVTRLKGAGAALSPSQPLTASAPGVTSRSTMIAVKPRSAEAEQLASGAEGGLPADTLHVTLCYLGEYDGDLEHLASILRPVAAQHAPLAGNVAGVGSFIGGDDGAPCIALPSVPGLVELRVAATAALADAQVDYSRDYGYVPHITLAYQADPEHDRSPLGTELHFDDLLIVRGDVEVIPLPLVGSKPVTASGSPVGKTFETLRAAACAIAAFAIVEQLSEVADEHAPDGGYGDTWWRESDGSVFWVHGDWTSNEEVDAAVEAFYEIDEVESVESCAECGPPDGDGWEKVYGSSAMTAAGGPSWTAPSLDEMIDLHSLVGGLRTKTDPVRRAMIETTMRATLDKHGIDFDVTNPSTRKVLAHSGEQITEIAKTTQLNVNRIVGASYREGLSIPDTARAIRAGMTDASMTRATLIARTEMTGAVNGGSLAATEIVADATGMNFDKQWLTASGAMNPRHELYDGLNGQTVPLDGVFQVGADQLQYPGDPAGDPSEVCNCRCTIVYTEGGAVVAEGDADAGGYSADDLAAESEDAAAAADGGEADIAALPDIGAVASEVVDPARASELNGVMKDEVAAARFDQETILYDPESGRRIPDELNYANAVSEIGYALEEGMSAANASPARGTLTTRVKVTQDGRVSAAVHYTTRHGSDNQGVERTWTYVEHLGSTVRGQGTELMREVARDAIRAGDNPVLHLQSVEEQVGFYKKLGFKTLDAETNEMEIRGEALRKLAGDMGPKEEAQAERVSKEVVERLRGVKISDDPYIASLQRERYTTTNKINGLLAKEKRGTMNDADRGRLEALRKRQQDIRDILANGAGDPAAEKYRVQNQINYMNRLVRSGDATAETRVRLELLIQRRAELTELMKTGTARDVAKSAKTKIVEDSASAARDKKISDSQAIIDAKRASNAKQRSEELNAGSTTSVAAALQRAADEGKDYIMLPEHDMSVSGMSKYPMGPTAAFMYQGVVVKTEVVKQGQAVNQALIDRRLQSARHNMERVMKDMPPEMQGHLDLVNIAQGYSPDDEYWAKTYKGFSHAAAQGGSGKIWFWNGDSTITEHVFDHEMGHIVGEGGGPFYSDDWTSAQKRDSASSFKKFEPGSGFSISGRHFQIGEMGVTSYAENSIAEDWAESVRLWALDRKKGNMGIAAKNGVPVELRFKDVYPARAKLIDRWLGVTG